jgi:hypothetical protein
MVQQQRNKYEASTHIQYLQDSRISVDYFLQYPVQHYIL